MSKPSLSFTYLSLFTTIEKANEIEGDLIEQSHHQTKLWFGTHVLLTGLALFRQVVIDNLASVFLLSYATYELMTKVMFLGIRPLQIYLRHELDLSRMPGILVMFSLLFLMAFVIGGALIRFLPRLGIEVAVGTIAFCVLRMIVLQEGYTLVDIAIYIAAPLLMGSVYIHRKNLRHAIEMEGAI